MANQNVALFNAANLSANIGQFKQALARVRAQAPQVGGTAILRLDKEGVWRYGAQLVEVEPGSHWAANPLSFFKGYISWPKKDASGNAPPAKKPLDKIMKNIMSYSEVIDPHTLPANGGTWSECVQFDLQCLDGEDKGTLVQFTGNSMGQVERWYELVGELSAQADRDPTKLVPVISLQHDGYFHPNASYGVRHPETKQAGWIVKPLFKVVDWMALEGAQQEVEADEPEQAAAPAVNAPDASARRTATPPRRQSTIQTNGEAQRSTAEAASRVDTGVQPDPVVRRRRRAAT